VNRGVERSRGESRTGDRRRDGRNIAREKRERPRGLSVSKGEKEGASPDDI